MSANEDTPLCGENVTEEQLGNSGSEIVDIGSTDAELNVEIPDPDGHSSIDVEAERLDGEPSYVHLHARVGGVNVGVSLHVDEAQQLAAKLNSAAAFAGGEVDE